MSSITEIARTFFEACEKGKGWEGCSDYCTADATFSAQAEPLLDVKTLEQYADWMKALHTFMPDAGYEIKSFATDEERRGVCVYAVFSATHTGEGGLVHRQERIRRRIMSTLSNSTETTRFDT